MVDLTASSAAWIAERRRAIFKVVWINVLSVTREYHPVTMAAARVVETPTEDEHIEFLKALAREPADERDRLAAVVTRAMERATADWNTLATETEAVEQVSMEQARGV